MTYGPTTIDERFTGGLDLDAWTPAYMPAWSSLEEARATYAVDDDGLHLCLPPEHPRWCAHPPNLHEEPMRVSAVQSGNRSGPVGSADAQQPFREGLVVTEAQPTQWGFAPHHGVIEVTCRATIGPRSMFSAWMVGLEDAPERCGEICIVEVFGDTVRDDGTVALGRGVHRFHDPALTEEFSADPYPLDVAALHRYTVDWRPGRVDFLVDDVHTRTVHQAPDYPLQLILGVFHFDRRPDPEGREPAAPELVVRRVLGMRP